MKTAQELRVGNVIMLLLKQSTTNLAVTLP